MIIGHYHSGYRNQRYNFSRLQYRERSDRMPHSIFAVILTITSVASGRSARGTVMMVRAFNFTLYASHHDTLKVINHESTFQAL